MALQWESWVAWSRRVHRMSLLSGCLEETSAECAANAWKGPWVSKGGWWLADHIIGQGKDRERRSNGNYVRWAKLDTRQWPQPRTHISHMSIVCYPFLPWTEAALGRSQTDGQSSAGPKRLKEKFSPSPKSTLHLCEAKQQGTLESLAEKIWSKSCFSTCPLHGLHARLCTSRCQHRGATTCAETRSTVFSASKSDRLL